MRRRTPAVLAALVLAAALAACGGKDAGSAAASSEPAPAAESSATAEPATAAAVPSEDPVAAEDNPPGDIPDDLAFVRYRNSAGHYSITHPEGWAETEKGSTVTFTDKLNSVHVEVGDRTSPATAAGARKSDVPALRAAQPAFELRDVTTFSAHGASGVKIVYRRNSAPDPLTDRQYRDEVERYCLVLDGRELVVELSGPVGADNVDAYRTMIADLTFS